MYDEIIRLPIHPGRVFLELFTELLGLSQNKLAEALDVDPGLINRIVTGKSSITSDTGLRLARYLGTTPQVRMNLQSRYELEIAKAKKSAEIEKNVQMRAGDVARGDELPGLEKTPGPIQRNGAD